MSRTIFFKLMVTTLIIILISFLAAGILLYGFLGEYAVSEKEKTLKHYADRIVEMAEYLVENNNPVIQRIFSIYVEGYGENSNSIIFIADSSGEIVLVSVPSLKRLEGQQIDSQLIAEVNKGNEVRKIGEFGGLLDKTFLTLGYPIKYNNETIGSVFMNTTLPELQRLRSEVYSLFLKAIGISALIAVIAIYFMSRKISYPLREISMVAKKIASGDFNTRVKVISNDEVGELAQTFNYMAEALGNLENMRKNFIANVSHELRTPMTSIIGFVEGIMDGTIPKDKQNHYLTIVKDETTRLTKLVNDLLDLARIESGEVPINPRVFDISELIRRNIIKFENQINNKNLDLEINLEKEHHAVIADPDGIERVLTNLLDNAIKFTPEGGTIYVRTSAGDDKVNVTIEDTGIGIDKEDLPYIWERFFKTDKSRSKDKIGTGLGLAIIKNIIKKHQQNIWVESEQNKGSKFTFTLENYEG